VTTLSAALAGSEAPDLAEALDRVAFPAYVTDDQGRIRGLNAAAQELVGDVRGRFAANVVVPGDQARVQDAIARKLVGGETTEFRVSLVTPDGGALPVDVSSVPLRRHGVIVGVFGLLHPVEVQIPPMKQDSRRRLTPREHEVLTYLVAGASTDQMAEMMGLSPATIRNHVKRLLRALGVHSRLEAVAVAHRDELVELT
jgi:PAS domain S-box-containing protein